MDQDMMVKVDHVSKQYRLGMIGSTTLREEMQRKLAKLKKREDPTRKLGEEIDGNIGDLFYALNDVSFDIHRGEAVGIIGHNGAGKSTILKLISQVTGPTKGAIELNGRVASMLEVGTGFHPELSGRENIYMNGAILGMTRTEIDSKIEDIIDFSECRQFIDTPVKRYSSGMYVKLAFSVAAHLDSEIMIMDEVLAVGDAKFQEKCLGRMGDEAHGGRTILYVSHNMNTIRSLCNRVIVLDHGKKAFDGDVEQGIAIYNGLKHLSSGTINLRDMRRSSDYLQRKNSLAELKISRGDSRFEFGSSVGGVLTIECHESFDNAGFLFRVMTVGNVGVTRMDTKTPISLIEGVNSIPFQCDISKLVPGKYIMDISLIQRNSWGNIQILDCVSDAYCFEVTADSENQTVANWNAVKYGYYIGPEIRVL